ncbi:phosphogluconate dehydrogenase (NAD(+)-dependent, decarboxylating) [Streptomyces gamaensis]|uniref:Phosphogluconate dehydrogenase (NAD(+)-dependent, decarboxylating) n=1 Tax=Streptomyces gamaensis TaxID=1763542 RepID=A0ABW0Z9W2_9ACTN
MATGIPLQIGMIGLGRMGADPARRLMRDGHRCVVNDLDRDAVRALEQEGATPALSLQECVDKLEPPRNVWLMLPAGAVQPMLDQLVTLLDADDTVIDGGNSYYRDDIVPARQLARHGIHFVDCGTSGGVWGLERGYCLMIGGDDKAVQRLDPVFRTIAPGTGTAEPTPSRTRTEDAGLRARTVDAETAPLRDPDAYQYEIDVAEVAEVWRRGSVVSSWLVDLVADAFARSPALDDFAGRVSDSGEGRWTVHAAIDESVPAPVISAALGQRYESRDLGTFTAKALSAMRSEFGGHAEKKE